MSKPVEMISQYFSSCPYYKAQPTAYPVCKDTFRSKSKFMQHLIYAHFQGLIKKDIRIEQNKQNITERMACPYDVCGYIAHNNQD